MIAAGSRASSGVLGLILAVDLPTYGVGGVMLAVLAYLFKELRRKDDSVWQIIAEKDRELEYLRNQVDVLRSRSARYRAERDFWRGRRMEEAEEGYEATAREVQGHRELETGDDREGDSGR